MIKHVDFDSAAWQVRMENARSGEEIRKIYPETERTGGVESLIVTLTALAMKRLRTGYGVEDCPTLEEYLLIIWLEDCITLDPYL